MPSRVHRETVDLSSYPDLVVVYLGMRVNRLYGLRTLVARGLIDDLAQLKMISGLLPPSSIRMSVSRAR